MAAITGGISLGDAVLRAVIDLSDLNAGLDQINAEVAAKLKPSGDAVADLSKGFSSAGTAASDAGKKISQVAEGSQLPALGAEAKILGTNLQAVGQQAEVAGAQISNSAQAPLLRIKALEAEVVLLRQQLQQTGAQTGTAFSAGDEAIAQLQAQIATLETEITALNLKIAEMGTSFVKAGAETEFSMRAATGTVGLLGEATGVALPRHVRTFLAELPGVGAALEHAFSAVAVYFLIEALIQGAEKLSQFIADTFIFTEAMKKSNQIISDSNKVLGDSAAHIRDLQKAYELLGLTGFAKTSEEMKQLNVQIADNSAKLIAAKAAADKLNDSTDAFKKQNLEQVTTANTLYAELAKKAQDFEQQKTNLQKQGGQERQAEARKEALTQLQIEKEQADSIALQRANTARQLVADASQISERLTTIDALYQKDLYDNQLLALKQKLALDKLDRTKDPSLIAQDNANIEILQRNHASALIKIYADTLQGINALSLGETGHGFADHLLGTDFHDKFAEFEADAKTLGIVTNSDLKTSLEGAAAAYTRLKDSGKATYDELLHALLKVQQAQLAFDRDLGNTVASKQDQQAIDNLERSIHKLEGTEAKFTDSIRRQSPVLKSFQQELKNTGSVAMATGAALGTGISIAMQAYAQGSITIQQALKDIVKAEIQAVASIAEVKGTEQLARAFGSWPDFAAMAQHFASAALWFGLAGAASAGSAALSGNSGGSSSSAASSGTQAAPSAATQPTQQPTQVVNVQSFAGGGLLTKKTLGVLADTTQGGDQREAVLPLGQDSKAIEEIAGRIFDRMPEGAGGSVVVHVHIKGDVIDHHHLMKNITREVNKGTGRLGSSNSFRTTRRG